MYTVEIDINGNIFDISSYVISNSIRARFNLFNELKPTSNSVDFEAKLPNATVNAIVSWQGDIPVNIKKNDIQFFKGYLCDDYQTVIKRYDYTTLKCTAEDYTNKKLKKEWQSINTIGTRYVNWAVCTPASPATSLVHSIAALAGVSVSASIPDISTVIDYLVVVDSDKETYAAILEALLYEHNHVFYFDENGMLNLYNFVVTSTTTSNLLNHTNILGDTKINKIRRKYDYVKLEWNGVKEMANQLVFSDTTGASNGYKCNIDIPGNGYYPLTATATTDVFSDYSASGLDIVYVLDVTGAIDKDPAISIIKTDNHYKKINIKFKNNDLVIPKKITKLEFNGTVVVKDVTNITYCGEVSSKRLDYTATYIRNENQAKNLAQYLVNYYKYSKVEYEITSKADFPIGAIVDVTTTTNQIKGQVITKVFNGATGCIEYRITGVSEFMTLATETVANNNGAGVNNQQDRIDYSTAPQTIVNTIKDAMSDNPTTTPLMQGLVFANNSLSNIDYSAGIAGWAISNAGAEFNDIVARGKVYASEGTIGHTIITTDGLSLGDVEINGLTNTISAPGTVIDTNGLTTTKANIGGWLAKTDSFKSAEIGRRIELNPVDNRMEVWGAELDEPKTASGYLGGLSDPTNRNLNLDSTKFGFWAAEGESIGVNGNMEIAGGAFTIKSDASIDVQDNDNDKLLRFGSDTGNLGLHWYSSITGPTNNTLIASIQKETDNRINITTNIETKGIKTNDTALTNEIAGAFVAQNRAKVNGSPSSNILTINSKTAGHSGLMFSSNDVAKAFIWYNATDNLTQISNLESSIALQTDKIITTGRLTIESSKGISYSDGCFGNNPFYRKFY